MKSIKKDKREEKVLADPKVYGEVFRGLNTHYAEEEALDYIIRNTFK